METGGPKHLINPSLNPTIYRLSPRSETLDENEPKSPINRASQILKLNSQICEAFERSLEWAIEAGRLLHEQKAELKYGEWGPWLKENIIGPGFSRSQVGHWMKLYEERDTPRILETRNLSTAIRLAYTPRKDPEPPLDDDEIAERYPVELCFGPDHETEFDELREQLKDVLQTDTQELVVIRALRFVNHYRRVFDLEHRKFKDLAAIRLGKAEWKEIHEQHALPANADD